MVRPHDDLVVIEFKYVCMYAYLLDRPFEHWNDTMGYAWIGAMKQDVLNESLIYTCIC